MQRKTAVQRLRARELRDGGGGREGEVKGKRTGAILSRWENEITRDYAAAAVTLRHEKEEAEGRAAGGREGGGGKLLADGKVTSLIGA